MATIVAGFSLAWRQFGTIPLRVLGQPSTAGQLQQQMEAPFFKNLAATTKLPLVVTYRTADAYGLKDNHQLDALRDGRLDVISLRFMQNSEKERALEGIDLPGMNRDFNSARKIAEAYGPTIDRYLQQSHGAKLLGIWSFGPQVMFCNQPIASLEEIRGRKIRVASTSLAEVIRALGGKPAILPFGETKEALALGLISCGVTSAASANFDNWGEHTRYYFPLVFQFGFNGYAISLKKWRSLSAQQQQKLSEAFRRNSNELWHYSEQQQHEAENCLTGGPCQHKKPNQLKRISITRQDIDRLVAISREIALPTWLRDCEQVHPGCAKEWNRTAAPLAGFAANPSGKP